MHRLSARAPKPFRVSYLKHLGADDYGERAAVAGLVIRIKIMKSNFDVLNGGEAEES